jgi:tRNA A-37 threonylcarbamoyl transferase component Bud32
MRNLEKFLSKTTAYQDAVIQKTFKSEKHNVALITLKSKPRVIKWYQQGFKRNMNKEYKILTTYSSSLTIPSVYEKDEKNNVLLLQYIAGENLCDLINSTSVSREEKTRLIIFLAQWYAQFHQKLQQEEGYQIHGDAHLHNFLFSDRIWGFDFEESAIGEPVQDIARVSASILTTDPAFTREKLQLTQTFITTYQEAVHFNL